MFHTFNYKGYYIHVAVDPDTKRERVEWQGDYHVIIPAGSVHGAKCAITRHINRINK